MTNPNEEQVQVTGADREADRVKRFFAYGLNEHAKDMIHDFIMDDQTIDVRVVTELLAIAREADHRLAATQKLEAEREEEVRDLLGKLSAIAGKARSYERKGIPNRSHIWREGLLSIARDLDALPKPNEASEGTNVEGGE
ncbi:MAG: hypothetical protein AAGB23_05410 [Pseudomonadota bacterium]